MTRRRAAYSVFDTAFLARRVARAWGLDDPACEYWGRHVHDTYRVKARGRTAFLRVYRHGWRPLAEIRSEVELLRHLRRRGLRVAQPLEKADGTCIERIVAAEGARHAVLFAAAKGAQPAMDAPNSKAYGRLVATLHREADRLAGRIARPTLDMDYLAWEPLARIRAFWAHRPRDVAYLEAVAERSVRALEPRLARAAPQFGLCHGDLHFGNVLRDGAGRMTLLDFDCAGYGWRAHDIGVFLWSRGWGFDRAASRDRARQWNAFLAGYRAVRRLGRAEVEAASLFVPLHQIWVMGLWIGLREGFGRRWLGEADFDRHLAFVRGWMRRNPAHTAGTNTSRKPRTPRRWTSP